MQDQLRLKQDIRLNYIEIANNDRNKFMTIDNLNSENDTCVELNQNALSTG